MLSLSPTHVYCFWRSDPQVANSDLQLTFTPASYREGVQGELEREPGMTVASWQQRPESRGYVRLRSADPFEAPIILPLARLAATPVLGGGRPVGLLQATDFLADPKISPAPKDL